ncbi:MAG TPA: phosphoenolpyruvate--protein phosphotransferase [Phycisphaerae bacterium]|jgi:phosphotransferase system enzyme I (PtsI)|nr:phosphoenolpyruvate--protein phosphotransferase [Phycisphaerae bacterium]
MEIKKGIGVSAGVVVCQALILSNEDLRIGKRAIHASQIEGERQRLSEALASSRADIRQLRDHTTKDLGPETGAIFNFHLGLLDDPTLLDTFYQGIEKNRFTAEYAVSQSLRDYSKQFLRQKDAYFRERVKDIYDIERRLINKLQGHERVRLSEITEPVCLVAHDLTPSQTASLDRAKVRAICIDAGGKTSHTAIIANSMGIPAIVGLENITGEVNPGDTLIVNGQSGVVIINPDDATLQEHKKYEAKQVQFEEMMDKMRDLPARTKDGTEITLMGNIEFPHEVENALAKGAVGIGLYRTEFLYLASEQEPTEEDHYGAYAEAIRKLEGRPIIIRTLDLGADKYTPWQKRDPEDNPFLGCRSIRLCLQNLDMFKVQLRAIMRASVLGDVRVMFPMITTPMELRQAKMVLKDVMEELDEESIPYNPYMPVGMMVEVPSAALMASTYSKECDFFSIGTNDLIQYTLAVDRGNQKVASLYTGAHPAVLSLIRNVIRVGNRANINVSLCGELGADIEFVILLVGMGLRTLSITPHSIPEVKKVIRSIDVLEAQKVARRVMSFEHTQQILSYLKDETRKVIPEAYGD